MINNECQKFCFYIEDMLQQHPEWTPEAIQAVTKGAALAHQQMRHQLGKLTFALQASAALINEKRLSDESIKMFNEIILQGFRASEINLLSPAEIKGL